MMGVDVGGFYYVSSTFWRTISGFALYSLFSAPLKNSNGVPSMPLWLIALLFLVGLYWIAVSFLGKLSKALASSVDTLLEEFRGTSHEKDPFGHIPMAGPEPGPKRTLNDRLAYLYEGIEKLELHLEEVERLLLPMAVPAASRFEKLGWDRFLQLRRNMDKAISLSEDQKRHRKIMRDEHGALVLVYEDEIEAARKRGWTD